MLHLKKAENPKKWNVKRDHQKKDNIKGKEKQENMERTCAVKKK